MGCIYKVKDISWVKTRCRETWVTQMIGYRFTIGIFKGGRYMDRADPKGLQVIHRVVMVDSMVRELVVSPKLVPLYVL